MSSSPSTNWSKWTMSDEGRLRAHRADASQRKKEARLLDGQSAMADYDAARGAQRENMARLKALRLARDAADALLPRAVGPAKKRMARKKP